MFSGRFTPSAVKAFLRAKKLDLEVPWPQEILDAAAELAGLCCFRTAGGALEWGTKSDLGSQSKEVYLALKGKIIGECPEDDSLLIGDPHSILGPFKRSDFIAQFIDSQEPTSN